MKKLVAIMLFSLLMGCFSGNTNSEKIKVVTNGTQNLSMNYGETISIISSDIKYKFVLPGLYKVSLSGGTTVASIAVIDKLGNNVSYPNFNAGFLYTNVPLFANINESNIENEKYYNSTLTILNLPQNCTITIKRISNKNIENYTMQQTNRFTSTNNGKIYKISGQGIYNITGASINFHLTTKDNVMTGGGGNTLAISEDNNSQDNFNFTENGYFIVDEMKIDEEIKIEKIDCNNIYKLINTGTPTPISITDKMKLFKIVIAENGKFTINVSNTTQSYYVTGTIISKDYKYIKISSSNNKNLQSNSFMKTTIVGNQFDTVELNAGEYYILINSISNFGGEISLKIDKI